MVKINFTLAPIISLTPIISFFVKALLFFVQLLSVIFFILVVADCLARTIFFSEEFMTEEYKVVSSYEESNYIMLNRFSYKLQQGQESFFLGYTLIPKSFSSPYTLELKVIDGSVNSNKEGNIWKIILSFIYFLFGMFTLISFFRKYGDNFSIGHGGPH